MHTLHAHYTKHSQHDTYTDLAVKLQVDCTYVVDIPTSWAQQQPDGTNGTNKQEK